MSVVDSFFRQTTLEDYDIFQKESNFPIDIILIINEYTKEVVGRWYGCQPQQLVTGLFDNSIRVKKDLLHLFQTTRKLRHDIDWIFIIDQKQKNKFI